jgi:hypothetical protein
MTMSTTKFPPTSYFTQPETRTSPPDEPPRPPEVAPVGNDDVIEVPRYLLEQWREGTEEIQAYLRMLINRGARGRTQYLAETLDRVVEGIDGVL